MYKINLHFTSMRVPTSGRCRLLIIRLRRQSLKQLYSQINTALCNRRFDCSCKVRIACFIFSWKSRTPRAFCEWAREQEIPAGARDGWRVQCKKRRFTKHHSVLSSQSATHIHSKIKQADTLRQKFFPPPPTKGININCSTVRRPPGCESILRA